MANTQQKAAATKNAANTQTATADATQETNLPAETEQTNNLPAVQGGNLPAETEPETVAATEETYTVDNSGLDTTKLLATLARVKQMKIGLPLNGTYYSFDAPGQLIEGVYCGMHEIPANEELSQDNGRVHNGMIRVAKILAQNEKGENVLYLVGGIVAVNTFGSEKHPFPLMVPVRILCVSMEKGKVAGKYANLQINQLY